MQLGFACDLRDTGCNKVGPGLAFTRYRHDQYCMLNGKTEGVEGNHILCNTEKKYDGIDVNKGGVECQELYLPLQTSRINTHTYLVKAKP